MFLLSDSERFIKENNRLCLMYQRYIKSDVSKCPKCGHQIKSWEYKCPKCGTEKPEEKKNISLQE
jgi:tRNA(Ile2) C34 agmatinyltransferase TiaS